ncbi:MAG: outer membrane protein assembly factor BamD, partial [Methylotenera sp.]
MKYILIFSFTLLLNACAIFGDPTELDDTRGLSAEAIYQKGAEKMLDKDFEKAIGYFKKLESRYPHGVYATQAQLEIAYAYYKKQEPVLAVAAADRFIKLHPNHQNVDYAYYL